MLRWGGVAAPHAGGLSPRDASLDHATFDIPREPVTQWSHRRDGWHFENQPLAAGRAEVAWVGSPPIPLGYGAKNVVLNKSTWINPKPEVPVARLDFVLNKPNTRPFVVAITADPVED